MVSHSQLRTPSAISAALHCGCRSCTGWTVFPYSTNLTFRETATLKLTGPGIKRPLKTKKTGLQEEEAEEKAEARGSSEA